MQVYYLACFGLCVGFFERLGNVYGFMRWHYFLGGVRLCGVTGTVFGPGFGASGFFLGVGEGVDLLCGFTGTVFVAIGLNFKG